MASADKRCPLCASVFCLRADPERCRHTGQRRPGAAAPEPTSAPEPEPVEETVDEPEADDSAEDVSLEDLTVPALRELAKEREIQVDSRATKAELIEALS